MVDHQIHFGKKFYRDKKAGYWISTCYPRIRAHQWIWLSIHKIIPKGYHIHHLNEDKSDNRIENLELIEKSRHLKHHMSNPSRKAKSREMAHKYRYLTKEWHRSELGRAWHVEHGKITWQKRKPIEIICKICNKSAKTKTYHQEFCSNACKSKCRRYTGVDNVKRKCVVCDNEYFVNKYSKTVSCSRKCVEEKKRREK